MPTWVHRTDKTLLTSVASADLPESQANYIEDPDLSAVAGFESRYWTITGDVVSLQSPAERAATDAALDAQARIDARPGAIAETTDIHPRIRALIELFNKRDNYLTNRIVELQEDLQAIKATSGPADNIRQAIRASYLATNTRPRPDAVTDYTDAITAGSVDT